MMDMPTLMSKFLAMGMPLNSVVEAATWKPAQVIKRKQLGHLSVGAPADLAVWKLMEGKFGFRDSFDGLIEGNQRLHCELTLLAGKVMWDWNGRTGRDYRELGTRYGVREEDTLMEPK